MNKQTVQVTLALPEKFHRVLKAIAGLQGETVEESIMRHVIVGVDGDLGSSAGEQMYPLIKAGDYQSQLRELAGVGA